VMVREVRDKRALASANAVFHKRHNVCIRHSAAHTECPHSRRVLEGNRTIPGHWKSGTDAEYSRGISPRASHRTGLDILVSSGSCHRAKAAAFH
jgi:hypothetical protein